MRADLSRDHHGYSQEAPIQLHDFRVLSFDCYGTLIDWESGILAGLAPLIRKAHAARALEAFARHESRLESEAPAMAYSRVLQNVYRELAAEWDVEIDDTEPERFSRSIAAWPAFPDTAPSLRYLSEHFGLVILSNVDRRGFAMSEPRLGVRFDAVLTAEDIGSYKPDARNFRYLLEHMASRGVARSAILHTAQSLYHDHVPAGRCGLASCWIDRRAGKEGFGATPRPAAEVHPDFHFPSLAAMVEAHQAEARK